jgi:AcrR family transcriptional regulator
MGELSTREKIEQTIESMRQSGSHMTISSVARECGISGPTIHNRYQDLAERIREMAGQEAKRDADSEREKRRGKIKEEKAKQTVVREELAEVKGLLRKADSVNAALQLENERLQAQLEEMESINRRYLLELNQREDSSGKSR